MKSKLFYIFFVITILFLTSWSYRKTDGIATGRQRIISIDNSGVVRVVYGQQNKIFCTTSKDNGLTFSTPNLVAEITSMHLGMSRGPQIASSAKCLIITAIDKTGVINWFKLNHSSNKWKPMGTVNDLQRSAPEGLMSIAADKKDNFCAVWLDIRAGKNNQVYFSSISGNADHWKKNVLAYESPFGYVCECCKPNIAVQTSEVAIVFRNWVQGSRICTI